MHRNTRGINPEVKERRTPTMPALVASLMEVELRRRFDEDEEEFEDGYSFDDEEDEGAEGDFDDDDEEFGEEGEEELDEEFDDDFEIEEEPEER